MSKCFEQSKKTVKIAEGNDFTFILPLKTRTYVSNVPIDTPIVYSELEDVALTIGGIEYEPEIGLDGVQTFVHGLQCGAYDVVLTATYHGASIRAAYFEGITIVPWSYQGDSYKCIQGSPIVADAIIVIGGPLTDEQLAELKAQYIEATADARAAEAAAIAKEEEYAQKIEELDGIAKETTSQQILTAVGNIDLSNVAKQGSNPNATNSRILEEVVSDTAEIKGAITAAKNEILAALPQEASAEFIQSLFANES